MKHRFRLATLLVVLAPSLAASQAVSAAAGSGRVASASESKSVVVTTDTASIVVAAGTRYEAGGFHRFFMGHTYRDLWTTRFRVQVLNLRTYAGGLRAFKASGGHQTKSVRLVTPDGVEYVFRCVDKDKVNVPPRFKGTVVSWAARDQVSATFPGGALVVAPLLEAAHVLHVTPVLAVMPDDPLLGKFRKDFAGRLGMLEEHPNMPKHHAGFAGASEIIDSDSLLRLINSDPRQHVDAPELLAARLMDMLFNDWDRHSHQWIWARLQPSPDAAWVVIPRDEDWAFGSVDGLVASVTRFGFAHWLLFDNSYNLTGLTRETLDFDRRLLGGLEKPAWDSVTAVLTRRLTDPLIDAAVGVLPAEYGSSAPLLARTLKQRRDGLRDAANRYYLLLAEVAEVHGTDAADVATIRRIDNRIVEVRLESGGGAPYFDRRFDVRQTAGIRVYLHGGDDRTTVTGNVQQSIPIRIIGGNGTNRFVDASTVGGHGNRARFEDVGSKKDVRYGPDTAFNRRPWVDEYGTLAIPTRDRDDRFAPLVGLTSNRDLGIVPSVGVNKYRYGFRHRPYTSMVGLRADYSVRTGGLRVGLTADKRRESSAVHFLATAHMSQLELLNFHGFGNTTPDAASSFFAAGQRQWLLQAAVARSLGRRSDLSLGPVAQYSISDSSLDRYLSTTRPYGFGSFGQAGVRLNLHVDTRDVSRDPRRGVLLDFTGTAYPAVWDVTSAFGAIGGGTTLYLTFPVPAHPVLVLHGGAKKVFGTFPFYEAAFIGGYNTLRSLHAQRYAGDGSLYGSVELRFPVAKFAFILPLDAGIFGIVDAGRVYVNGDSPGGWHTSAGIGFWIGMPDPATAVRVCRRPAESGPC
jgi:hypothetical protein